jgi:hypothetical protein
MNLYINTLFVCSSYTPERKYPLPLTGKSRSYTIAHPYNLWFGARKHSLAQTLLEQLGIEEPVEEPPATKKPKREIP